MGNGSLFVLGSFVAACSVKVPHLPREGETLRAESLNLEAGGKGLNVAVAAHRLGMQVDGLFAIGADQFGAFAHAAFLRLELSPAMLVQTTRPTGAGVGFIDHVGENCIAVFPGANDALSAGHVAVAQTRLAKATLVFAQFEIADEPIAWAFADARDNGATTILSPSPWRSIHALILRNVNVLVVNEVEARHLAADFDIVGQETSSNRSEHNWSSLADCLFARGVRTLIVTQGKRGVVAWQAGGEPLHQPAFDVVAVDTIGAGDAFLGGLLAGFGGGLSLAQCLRQGAACGALATTRIGLLDTLPTAAQLSVFMAQGKYTD